MHSIEQTDFVKTDNMFKVPTDQHISFRYGGYGYMKTVSIEFRRKNVTLLILIGQFQCTLADFQQLCS